MDRIPSIPYIIMIIEIIYIAAIIIYAGELKVVDAYHVPFAFIYTISWVYIIDEFWFIYGRR